MKRAFYVYIVVLLVSSTAPVYGQTVLDALLARSQAGAMDAALVEAVHERADQAHLSAQQTAALLLPAVLLDEQGLPSRMVLQKTLEGLAKHVPFASLKSVLEELQVHTEAAGRLAEAWLTDAGTQRLLQPDASSEQATILVETLAVVRMRSPSEAMLEGVLQRLSREVNRPTVHPQDVIAALHVWPDLHTATTGSDTPSDFLIVALNSGFSERDFQQLPGALRTARQHSSPASVDLLSIITQQLGEGTSAARVLRQLRQGAF